MKLRDLQWGARFRALLPGRLPYKLRMQLPNCALIEDADGDQSEVSLDLDVSRLPDEPGEPGTLVLEMGPRLALADRAETVGTAFCDHTGPVTEEMLSAALKAAGELLLEAAQELKGTSVPKS